MKNIWTTNGCSIRKIGAWSGVFLFAGVLITAAPAQASDTAPEEDPAAEVMGVFGDGVAVVYTDTLIAPQYYKSTLIHHVFFKFAFVVEAGKRKDIVRQKLKLREVILDELNRYSFARPGAPKQLNIVGLKKHLLRRAQALFGKNAVHKVYLMSAISGRA